MQPVTDSRLPDKINNLDSRLKNIELSSQPELGDWRSLQPDYFIYSHSNALAITDNAYNARQIFATGTKVRIKQQGDTNYRYFYVTLIQPYQIRLDAGDDYTISNLPVTEIAYASPRGQAIGFPPAFTYTPGVSLFFVVGSLSIVDEGTVAADFRLVDDLCFVTLNREMVETSGAGIAAGLSETLPIVASDAMSYRSWMSSYYSLFSTSGIGSVRMNTSQGTDIITVSSTGGSSVVGSDTITYTLTFHYPIAIFDTTDDRALWSTDNEVLQSTDGEDLTF